MLKKTITYENIDGQEVTRDFYFHITQAEMLEEFMVHEDDGLDIETRWRKALSNEDKAGIMREFKGLIERSVGRRNADGDFVKTPDYAQQFMSSEAYSELFSELVSSTQKLTEFFNGLFPRKLREQVEAQMKQQGITVVELPESGTVETIKEPAAPTPFPTSLESAVVTNKATSNGSVGTEDEPAWFREQRYATIKELRSMNPEEMRFAMQAKSNKLFG